MKLVDASTEPVEKVKEWNKEVLGNIFHYKNRHRKMLEGFLIGLAIRPSAAWLKLEG